MLSINLIKEADVFATACARLPCDFARRKPYDRLTLVEAAQCVLASLFHRRKITHIAAQINLTRARNLLVAVQ